MWVFDPVVVRSCQIGLSLILFVGAAQKLSNMGDFESAVAGYKLVPDWMTTLVAWFIPLMECSAGMLLLVDSWRIVGATCAILVVLIVTLAVISNLLRGHVDIECGCGGVSGKSSLSWVLPIRNLVLILLAVISTGELEVRETQLLDYVSMIFSAFSMFLIYTTINQLTANHPLLASIKRIS